VQAYDDQLWIIETLPFEEGKFRSKSSALLFHTPFEAGWAKTRFI
jgi:hypothetical protein